MNNDDFKKKVWKKATPIEGKDPDKYRKDYLGNTIKYDHYGDTSKDTGWDVDQKKPTSNGIRLFK